MGGILFKGRQGACACPCTWLLCGHLWALCSHWGSLDKTSMPCYRCVYFHCWEHPFTFLCAVWKWTWIVSGRPFTLVPWQNSFQRLFTRNFRDRDSLEFYWQVIKSGPHSLFLGKTLGPLNHSVFCLSKKNPFYFSFVKSKAEEKKICTLLLCRLLVPIGLNSCGWSVPYLALDCTWKHRAGGGVAGGILE